MKTISILAEGLAFMGYPNVRQSEVGYQALFTEHCEKRSGSLFPKYLRIKCPGVTCLFPGGSSTWPNEISFKSLFAVQKNAPPRDQRDSAKVSIHVGVSGF